jgi:AhpD family alkylhydroperoxidase
MARLPYVTQEQLPESERDLFDHIEERFGRLNNIFRMLAYRPLLLRRLLHLAEGLRHATRLDPRLRELPILTVGRLTQCTYESVHHSALAQRLGVRLEQIERLEAWESDSAFTVQERDVIRFLSRLA